MNEQLLAKTFVELADNLGSRPLEWCIDGHSVISYLRLCGEFGGQDGLVVF
ncbi:hypothetical protein J7E87_28840 [Streptomyces sp. ISL-1]|uniref:hypothetical protein n=1 Tax=Streptomyces sp. ISL-1 TaxID=2817657 RepID=UPI001BE532B5|nr:hypothetical protein [Streptomyces sp. ISL-1]MBT2393321.1 hypothetical protein [Streptomyces sp. ISL-1]